jgi:hypothetical protein
MVWISNSVECCKIHGDGGILQTKYPSRWA